MTNELYPALVVAPLDGREAFHSAGRPAGFDVTAFWRWSASDLVNNALRGVLAEFLVARAIGSPNTVRTEWDACDLVSGTGIRVEVKSAAYLQSWSQRAPSSIGFDIAAKRGWDSATNTSAPEPCRPADVYVFALLAHRDKTTVDPLDLSQWHFYVVAKRALEAACGQQKRLSLSSLIRLAANPVTYEELGPTIAATAMGSPLP